MKKLLLVRHAKSDWGNLHLKDFDRPLNKRGKRNAPEMGNRLSKKEYAIDLIVSSTALRAKQTAELIADSISYDTNSIDWREELYHAQPSTIQEALFSLDDTIESAMLVCHNNGITSFANSLCGVFTDNMVTCAMAAFEIDAVSWTDFATADKTLLFYDFPKQ